VTNDTAIYSQANVASMAANPQQVSFALAHVPWLHQYATALLLLLGHAQHVD